MKARSPATIQLMRASATMSLTDAGRPATAIGPAPQLRGTDFAMPPGSVESGIWECEPGSFRRHVASAEVMHLLGGDATFTPDGEEPIELAAGDSLFFPANTQGTWVIKNTVRKLYVIL
jgi:uncharacterized cupin superfamily protein